MKRIATLLAAVLILSLSVSLAGVLARPANATRTNRHLLSETAGQKQVTTDPYAYLQDVLRKPGAGEKQVQGILTRVDCPAKSGITFVLKVGAQTLKLRTDRFEDLKITTFTDEVAGDLTCGPRKPENPVVMCYVPLKKPLKNARPTADGTAKSLEFVPKDFKLQTEAKAK